MLKFDIHLDIETQDVDDIMLLGYILAHPSFNLRSVTLTPGYSDQVYLVQTLLREAGYSDSVLIGSGKPISQFHNKGGVSGHIWKILQIYHPDAIVLHNKVSYGSASEVIRNTLAKFPMAYILTGARLTNLASTLTDILGNSNPIYIRDWYGQGGFAGSNIVSPLHELSKFRNMIECPTFNFDGDIPAAKSILTSTLIKNKFLLSKNVCHGIVSDREFVDRVYSLKSHSFGFHIIYKMIRHYAEKGIFDKKLHDLALPIAVLGSSPLPLESVFTFEDVFLYRGKKGWGSNPISFLYPYKASISVSWNKEVFNKIFFMEAVPSL